MSIRNILILLLTVPSAAYAQKPGSGAHAGKICEVSSYSMNAICKEWDGQWQGITIASDGNCYFGTSTHSGGHGAGFHMYNPETREHTVLAEDMTLVCGEGESGSQQGKIHSPIVECDGWLYFTTHLSNYWPEGIEVYPGAHVLGYEMATGRKQCLFTMGAWGGGDERLWLFDPLKDIYSGAAFEPLTHIGYTFHEIAIGGERLYFIQYADMEDQRTIMTEKGRIYMTGSWYLKSDREATFQVLFTDFPGERIYKLAKRGEFFAVAETAIDD